MDRQSKYRWAALVLALGILACGGGPEADSNRRAALKVPRGYVARLEVVHEGQRFRFGPFVGYYFRPTDPQHLQQLNFVVFNEEQFYTLDLPASAKLFEGQAVFAEIPATGRTLPGVASNQRINPVFFEQAPQPWLQSRPSPREEFVHFHSCYNTRGSVRYGYWLRHVGAAEFTYDMGGRVDADSPLYHRVEKGVDRRFARIVEFDRGPR